MLTYCQLDTKEQTLNQNTRLFIHENALENVVCKMVAILSKGDERVHPKKYTHGSRFTAFRCGVAPVDFTYILQDYLSGTSTFNPDEYE